MTFPEEDIILQQDLFSLPQFKFKVQVFQRDGIDVVAWPGNSPDLECGILKQENF